MKENWKDIPGFEGHYQVSDLGRVRSLDRIVVRGGIKGSMNLKGKIMSQSINRGYYHIQLKLNGKYKTAKIHQLVAMAFLDFTPCGMDKIIDHIDSDKQNNTLSNLQITDNRYNTSKGKLGSVKTSKYTGVYHTNGKWASQIQINGKSIWLGRFEKENDANLAYQEKLNELI